MGPGDESSLTLPLGVCDGSDGGRAVRGRDRRRSATSGSGSPLLGMTALVLGRAVWPGDGERWGQPSMAARLGLLLSGDEGFMGPSTALRGQHKDGWEYGHGSCTYFIFFLIRSYKVKPEMIFVHLKRCRVYQVLMELSPVPASRLMLWRGGCRFKVGGSGSKALMRSSASERSRKLQRGYEGSLEKRQHIQYGYGTIP